MLTETQVRNLLAPFELELSAHQFNQLLAYLKLLLRWNRRINLTAIRNPEECVTRHFGESLYLARWVELRETLLDIGSGAGFPGLALKIAFPEVSTTLLEPVSKKRAFLKEVARCCGMDSVEVRSERLSEFLRRSPAPSFHTATARAVARLDRLVPEAAQCLKPSGRLILWLTRDQVTTLKNQHGGLIWAAPIIVPLARQREIWVGTRVASSASG